MMEKLKRRLCLLLATLVLLQAVVFSYMDGLYPVAVAAEKKTLKDYAKDFWTDTKTAFGWFGDMVVGSYDIVGQTLSETANDMQTNFKNAVNNRFAGLEYHFSDGTVVKFDNPDKADGVGDWIKINENEDGTATVDDTTMDFFYGFIEEHKNYFIYKPVVTKEEFCMNKIYWTKPEQYETLWNVVNNYDTVCCGSASYSNDRSSIVYILDDVYCFYIDKDGLSKIYGCSEIGAYPTCYSASSSDYVVVKSTVSSAYQSEPKCFPDLYRSLCGNSIVVWNSKAQGMKYCAGQQRICNNVTYANYDKSVDNSVTTNIKNIYGRDWKKVSDDLERTISDALSENAYDDAALMELIQSETDKLVQAVEDATEDVVDSVEENTGILEKILKELKEIKTALLAFFGFSVVGDLIGDTVDDIGDKAAEIADSIADGLSDVASAASGRFPLSIPWDIALLVKCLAADPVPPSFTIPVKVDAYGIDESITLDFSSFDSLSKLSRGMLTLTFLVMLVWITFHMTGGGGDT